MKRNTFFILFLLVATGLCHAQELDNVFYAFHNSVRTLPGAPAGDEAQAKAIKDLGYDGMSGHHQADYIAQRRAMDKVGLAMPEIYLPVTIHEDGSVTFKEEIRDIIRDSKDRNLLVALAAHSPHFQDKHEEGDPFLVEAIRELADYAEPYGVKIAVYPHKNFYCERLNHSLRICKEVDRPNVGAIFNTFHLFNVEGEEGWREKLIEALPHLYMISINGMGAKGSGQKKDEWTILPLGQGTFDIYQIVKTAKDHGYEGPFGLQCFMIKEDFEAAMRQSITTWNEYRERYALDSRPRFSRELARFSLRVDNEVSSPVAIPLEGISFNLDTADLVLYRISKKNEIRLRTQLEEGLGDRLWFIMEGTTGKGEEREYILRLENREYASSPVIRIDRDLTDLSLCQYGDPVLKYRTALIYPPDSIGPWFSKNPERQKKHGAYIHPLWSPGGAVLTDAQPFDHPHHFGLWGPHNYCHIGDRKVNFWDLSLGLGTIRFGGILSRTEGDVFGGFSVLQEYIDFMAPGGEQVAINEVLDVRSWNIAKGIWVLDYTTTVTTGLETGIHIDQYRYGSGLGFRSREDWDTATCTVLSSEGRTMEDTDGSTGRWCRLEGISGAEEGRSGIVFMSHPSNLSHPEPLRVWPKPTHGIFLNFCPIKFRDWTLEPDRPQTQRYRMIIFDGEMSPELTDLYWEAFAHPPIPRFEEP